MSYNGWSNYETWAVALWLDNEPGTYEMTRDVLSECWDNAKTPWPLHSTFTPSETARYTFAAWLKDYVEEMAPDLGASLFSAALSEVNWSEIADNWLTEVDGYERAAAESLRKQRQRRGASA